MFSRVGMSEADSKPRVLREVLEEPTFDCRPPEHFGKLSASHFGMVRQAHHKSSVQAGLNSGLLVLFVYENCFDGNRNCAG